MEWFEIKSEDNNWTFGESELDEEGFETKSVDDSATFRKSEFDEEWSEIKSLDDSTTFRQSEASQLKDCQDLQTLANTKYIFLAVKYENIFSRISSGRSLMLVFGVAQDVDIFLVEIEHDWTRETRIYTKMKQNSTGILYKII